ncbi:hypothetical protein [Streptomyces sp. NPDC005859]|uniref:hypothetical protein n=1 Tax=Streptomyces sp. NPDC005859 TaxID=3157170 RepID=UPI0033F1BD38
MATDAVKTESPCVMMRREAESARRVIRRRRGEIPRLQSEIDYLKGHLDPDQKAMAALKQRLESPEEQLKQGELSLGALEQVIGENC